MHLNIFIYIILNLIIIQLTGTDAIWMMQGIELLCIIGIATFGIGHGAIDHLIYNLKTGERKKTYTQFIIQYIIVALVIALIWYLAPALALIVFLLVSAYHFGQSQFVDNIGYSQVFKAVLYVSWGGLVLSFMIVFNKAAFMNSMIFQNSMANTIDWMVNYAEVLTFIYLAIFIVSFGYFLVTRTIKPQKAALEVFVLALIACSFYLLPAFVAFSLFFVVIHSSKVLRQEYEFCKNEMKLPCIWSFIKLFLPLTMVSLAGIALIYLLVNNYSTSPPKALLFALLVLLSSITVPHAFVMEKFYR